MFNLLLPATFDTLWPDAMYAGHTGTDSGSPAQMRPRFAEGYQHSSCTFQLLSSLLLRLLQTRDPYAHRAHGVKRWSDFFCLCDVSTLSFYGAHVLLLNGLVCFDFPLLLRKHMALQSQLTPYDRAVIALSHIPSHTPPTHTHFSSLSLLWWRWMKHWSLCSWFSWETNQEVELK